jgi:hypothetical protein
MRSILALRREIDAREIPRLRVNWRAPLSQEGADALLFDRVARGWWIWDPAIDLNL